MFLPPKPVPFIQMTAMLILSLPSSGTIDKIESYKIDIFLQLKNGSMLAISYGSIQCIGALLYHF